MWLKRVVFYVSAGAIIFTAVCVSLFQLLTPLLNQHRADFEQWANTWLHMPVKIQSVSVTWHHYYPQVNLQQVSIYHPTTQEPLLRVKQVSALVSIPASIRQGKIVLSRFVIQGTTVDVYQNEKEAYVIKGFPELTANQASETPIDDIMNAFSNQPKLILKDISVFFTAKNQQKYAIKLRELQIANNADEHFFVGKAALQQAMPTELTAQVEWEGATFNLKTLNAKVYVHATNVSLSQWLKEGAYQGLSVSGGLASFKNWISIKNGEIDDVKAEVQLNALRAKHTSYFSKPLFFDEVDVKLNWHKEAKTGSWVINTTKLQLTSDVLTLSGKGVLLLPHNESPVIDFNADFSITKAQDVSKYLPDRLFEKGLNEWLAQAFLKGQILDGQAKIQGKLTDFPFDHDGTFLVSGRVKDVQLRYAPEWPMVDAINGLLTFSGRKIIIAVDTGKIDAVDITNVSAVIPYLGDAAPAILEVKTPLFNLDMSDGTTFLMKTPLKKTYAKILQALHPVGPAQLQLQLTVPLSDPDKTAVQGALTIKDSQLNMQDWGLQVEHLKGPLTFTENDVTADNLMGELFNKPLQVKLQTVKLNKTRSQVEAAFTTALAVPDLENWLKIKISDYVVGAANVKGIVHVSITEPLSVDLNSDLKGIAFNVQAPYSKTTEEVRPLKIALFASDKNMLRLRFNYHDALGGALLLNEKRNKFTVTALNLLLGSGTPEWPTRSGISITGYMEKIDWDSISQYTTKTNDTSKKLPFSLPLKYIDMQTDLLSIFNQDIPNLHLQLEFFPTYWDVDLHSSSITGRIKIPTSFTRDEVITAQLDSLNLNATGNSKKETSVFDLTSLPSIVFFVNRMKYNHIDLGHVSFKTETVNRGIAIHEFAMQSKNMTMSGEGWWTKYGARYNTQLSGTARSTNVSAFLASLGFDVHNYVLKDGEFKYDVTWKDAPYAPTLQSMSGSASLKIGKGQILEVQQTSGAKMDIGRMLSIFSLQTIPRRLSFDFSDIVQSGYSFDRFQGDFSIRNGSVATDNTYFEGPVARVGIIGSIGLIAKDYDFTLSVTPHVASSIPVAATLLTANPVVGVAAFAANKVLGSAISQATTYYYSVKGPWDKPVWQSISVRKANAQ